jgi:hypothetical protein
MFRRTLMSHLKISKPEASEHAPYYSKYIDLIEENDIISVLNRQLDETLSVLRAIPEDQADKRYEPGKWSIKELVGHIIDGERVFAYRALRFARNDKTPLAGFEQDDYVSNASFSETSLSSLADEFEHVRRGNLAMFKNFSNEAWLRNGVASENQISVRAIAYVLAGHELHHMRILRSRYL